MDESMQEAGDTTTADDDSYGGDHSFNAQVDTLCQLCEYAVNKKTKEMRDQAMEHKHKALLSLYSQWKLATGVIRASEEGGGEEWVGVTDKNQELFSRGVAVMIHVSDLHRTLYRDRLRREFDSPQQPRPEEFQCFTDSDRVDFLIIKRYEELASDSQPQLLIAKSSLPFVIEWECGKLS